MCRRMVALCDGCHIPCSSEEGSQAECAGGLCRRAMCSCIASAASVGDELESPACAIGFTSPVLLTARGRKELDPLGAKPLRGVFGDPGG